MILVTGADGFVGSNLMNCMGNCKKFIGDIRDKVNVDKQVKNSRIIVHLAALMDGKDIYEVNVDGTRNIVESAKKYKVKQIVYISSEYIFSNYKTPYTESKKKAEEIIKTFDNYTILRPTSIYGNDKKGLGKFINVIKKTYIVPIGKGTIQPIYVGDVVQYIINSIKYSIKGTYLIAGNSKISFRDFVKLVAKKINKKRIVFFIPFFFIYLIKIYKKISKNPFITSSQLYNMNSNRTYNIDKSIKDLKHKPLDLDAGLDKTINFS